MLELLRDGAWQAIGAFLTVATIVVSFLIYRWQRQRRALTYHVKSAYSLLKTAEELQGRLSVQVDGVAVKNIDVMFIEFANSGNHPIARSDFDLPLSIAFKPPARIISAVIDSEEPSNLGVELIVNEHQLSTQPMLLNAGDRFTLKMLLSRDSKEFRVDGRILGVKAIESKSSRDSYAWISLLGLVLVAGGLWFAVANTPKRIDSPPRPAEVWYGFGVAAFGYVLAAYSLTRRNSLPKLLRRLARLVETTR
jgi:hypothetical protein